MKLVVVLLIAFAELSAILAQKCTHIPGDSFIVLLKPKNKYAVCLHLVSAIFFKSAKYLFRKDLISTYFFKTREFFYQLSIPQV